MSTPSSVSLADFATLYREHIGMVRRRARQIVNCESAAEDVAQEVFIKFLKTLRAQREVNNVAGLLYRMATLGAIDKLQEHKRDVCIDPTMDDLLGGTGALQEAQVDVARVLARVSADSAVVACAYFIDGQSQDHIATELGISRRTVGRHLEAFTLEAQRMVGIASGVDGVDGVARFTTPESY